MRTEHSTPVQTHDQTRRAVRRGPSGLAASETLLSQKAGKSVVRKSGTSVRRDCGVRSVNIAAEVRITLRPLVDGRPDDVQSSEQLSLVLTF